MGAAMGAAIGPSHAGEAAMAGGAVNPGENKLDALSREVKEEVDVDVDMDWDGVRYMGGWQQSKARDDMVNDNFTVLVVRAKSEHMKPDQKEIKEARWFPWRKLLEAWEAKGRPLEKKVELHGLAGFVGMPDLPEDRVTLPTNTLGWLETFRDGGGLTVRRKTDKPQGNVQHVSSKVMFNLLH